MIFIIQVFVFLLVYNCDCMVTHNRGLPPGTKKLNYMLVDSTSENVYMAATNTLYVMDINLNAITKIDLGPRNDSLYCPPNPEEACDCPYSSTDIVNITVDSTRGKGCQNYTRKPTDAVVKNMIVDTNKVLIVCSNLYYGYCSKISLVDYKISPTYIPIVSNSLDEESIAFIAPSGYLQRALYFGVSRDIYHGETRFKDQANMLSVRNLKTFGIAHYDSATDSASFLDLRREFRDTFPVNFKYGFSYQDYSYFLVTRKESLQNNNTASYIFRVCQNDQRLHSYVEIKMECGSGNTNYNSLITAYVSTIGSDLADMLGISREDKVLFALFSASLPGSFMVSDHSTGICMYSLKDIESAFKDSVSYCFAGHYKTGPEHITQPENCVFNENEDGSYLCGESENNWHILGYQKAQSKAYYSFKAYRLTSISVKRTGGNKYTVGYLGTDNGNLIKVSFETGTSSPDFGVEHLSPDGKPIKKQVFDEAEQNLYVFTEQQVMKVLVVNCSQHSSCDKCLEAKDPHCGWCSLQNQCTEKSDCELGDTDYGWLSYRFLACPAATQLVPNKIAQVHVKETQVIFKLNSLPSEISMLPLTCELTNGEDRFISHGEGKVIGVSCTPFSDSPKLPDNTSVAEIDVDLWIQVVEQRWVKSQVKIFDCLRIKNCNDCVGGGLPCIWCMKTNMCMNDRDACSSSAVLSPETSLKVQQYSAADFTGKEFCPRIELSGGKEVHPSGSRTEIRLAMMAIQDYHEEDLKCRFDFQNGIVVNATYESFRRSILCDSTMLSYPGTQGYIDFPVQVLWDSDKLLDNPLHASVKVYKCEYLASDCGTCTFLDPTYKCGWCDGKCQLEEHCKGEFLNKDSVCPDPQITKITPAKGPYRGGTNLTIEGINLGKILTDVQDNILVAGINCKVRPELYKPPSSVVCVTSDSGEERTGKVKVNVAGKYAAVSDKYEYQDPVLVVYEPTKGPISGGTHVTISGQYLDMGSQVTVSINGKSCEVVKRDNNHLEFITSAQPAPINRKVQINFDDTMISELRDTFAFIADPRVTTIHPQSALESGGSVIVINGTNLDSGRRPMFYIHKDGNKIYSDCEVESKKTLNCPLPDLSTLKLTSKKKRSTKSSKALAELNYGLEIDGWNRDLAALSYDLDLNFHPIEVYPDPEVFTFSDENGIKPYTEDGMTFEIQGVNLDIFKEVSGLEVIVGNTSAEIVEITPDKIVARAPTSPNIIDSSGKSQVVVLLGNFKVETGYIQYATGSSSNKGVILGVIFGVIIPIILIVIVLYVIRRSKKKKKLNHIPVSRDNGVAEKGNIYTPPAEKENAQASETLPLKEMSQNNSCSGKLPMESDGEEEEEVAADKPFQLSDFLERIRDPKLRAHVQEVIITRDRLDMKDMIGRGNFGCVYVAELHADHDDNACRVAVKTLQGERLEQHTVEAFLKEGVIMKNFNHPHVLKLLGVCIDQQENPMVILPYMANGDLRTYVKDKKKNFTARQLLHLAQQVAEGMAYLSSLNFVHRDLAARNCMIDELDTVKVADFGLTRDLFEKQYFSTNLKEKRGKMPIKWMALESLEEFVFTTKSDVWSFGVLMWELMTRGVTPYPDVDIFDVRNYLASGRRLRKPKYCPENIYNIMLECWHADPDIRPSFTELVNRIELLLNPPKRRANREENTGEPMYVNIRKANSTEYLKPVDGSFAETPSPSPHENSNGSPVV